MSDRANHYIWKPDTGITGMEVDAKDLGASQIPGIKAIWSEQRELLRGSDQLKEFDEQLNREWAIETGIIENIYDIERGVTQTLIEHGFKADILSHGSTDKPKEYVIRLLNDQKDAIEGVFAFVKEERDLTTSYIKELHASLLRSQETTEGVDSQGRSTNVPLIKGDWKKQVNYPERDGVIYHYCPPEQVGSEMDKLCGMHKDHVSNEVPSEVQAAWLHHRFTQIHPFQDGNGRIARAIASLVLIKDGLFPLVVTRDDKPAYIEALESADRGDLKPLVDLITKLQIKRFYKARGISEHLGTKKDTDTALAGLLKAAERIGERKRTELLGVVDHARAVEDDIYNRLEEIKPKITEILQKVSIGNGAPHGSAYSGVYRAEHEKEGRPTDYYYRSQIIKNARRHLNYYADFSEHRSWVALNMYWQDMVGRLVFTIHGIGKPFAGSLICAPFLEFKNKDNDEDAGMRFNLVPVADDGFVFFYNEDRDEVLSRLYSWREDVIKVAIGELSQQL